MSKCTRKPLTAQAVQEAMEQHDGLVHAFIQRQGGGDISYEEALQAGRIGLWRAIRGYDPRRGTPFPPMPGWPSPVTSIAGLKN